MGEPAGKVVDKYEIGRLLGEGGMGEVYEAKHTLVGQRYALKLLRADMAADENIVKRMMREARAAAEIGHPNIVQTHDFGTLEDGACYLAMELLKGDGLDTLIQRHETLEIQITVAIMLQVLSALVSAHKKGIVHRDLKPENIFIAKAAVGGQVVKLLDFGISKFKFADEDTLRLTHTGAVMGTPYYMSPEQAGGAKDVDERSDLWSVGVILYQMLTGKLPFTGDNYNQLILKIVTKPFVAPRKHCPDIPERLEAVVVKALQKDIDNRYQKATQMIEALLPFYDRGESEAGRFVLREDLLRNPQRVSAQRPVVKEAFKHTAPSGVDGGSDPAIDDTMASGEPGSVGVQTGPGDANPFEATEYSGEIPRMDSVPDAETPPRDSSKGFSATSTRYSGSSPRLEMTELEKEARQSSPVPKAPTQDVEKPETTGQPRRAIPMAVILGAIAVAAVGALVFVLLRDKNPPPRAGGNAVAATSKPQEDPTTKPTAQRLNTPAPAMRQRPTPRIPITITLEGLPRRAKVFLDGTPVKHPIRMVADSAQHKLRVKSRRHHDYETSFIATSDLNSIALQLEKRTGRRRRTRRATKPRAKVMKPGMIKRWADPFTDMRPAPAMRPRPTPMRPAPAMRPRPTPLPAPMRRRPMKTDGVYGNPYGD